MGKKGSTAWVQAILQCPSITSINLGGCGLYTASIAAVARALTQAENRLTSVNVISDKMDDQGVQAIAAALGQSRITELNLSGSQLRTVDISAICGGDCTTVPIEDSGTDVL